LLIGRNGSGKTSLLSVLAAFRRATGGAVRVDGEDPFENERVVREICLIRESGDIIDSERCGRVLALARRLRPDWDQEYADRLVDRFGLPLRKRPQQLSRGQRSAPACWPSRSSPVPCRSGRSSVHRRLRPFPIRVVRRPDRCHIDRGGG
jgi:ABC-2 type transport system ATP-binding protein